MLLTKRISGRIFLVKFHKVFGQGYCAHRSSSVPLVVLYFAKVSIVSIWCQILCRYLVKFATIDND